MKVQRSAKVFADVNGHNGQQAGTSEGQYQNMHLMQNTDTYDQQMPSTSMDDPNSFYLNQQPSTSMANDNGMNDNYDMMAQQPGTYMPQIDQMDGPSSNQQSQPSQEMEVQPAKSKPKKSRPNNNKKQGAAGAMTVGSMLTEVHKMQQKTTTNSGVEKNEEENGLAHSTFSTPTETTPVFTLVI